MLKDKEYERDDLFIEMQLCIKKLNYIPYYWAWLFLRQFYAKFYDKQRNIDANRRNIDL